MNKMLPIILVVVLSGCATKPISIGNNLFRTSCPGMFTSWSACYEAANTQCMNGFTEKDRQQINHPGQYNTACACMLYPIDRFLVFSCR